jgi:cytochrome b
MGQTAPTTQRIKLWDAPTRLFHWSLVAAIAAALVTGLVGGNWMELHGKAGLFISGLLVFRLVWGFVGNRYARFVHFIPTPSRVLAYVRGHWQGMGHNPLGALSVLALLLLLTAQVGTGLFGNDEIAFTGPLAARVSEALSLRLTHWHHGLAKLLYLLLGLHVAAIAFYRLVKKDDLVKPMLTGFKDVTDPSTLRDAPDAAWWIWLLALALAVAAVLILNGTLLPQEVPAPAAASAPAVQPVAPKPAW